MSQARILHSSRTAAFVVLGGTGAALYPRRTAFAEAPSPEQLPDKKPIYSEFPVAPTKPKPSSTSPVPPSKAPNSTSPTSTSTKPTPTDRLTAQIKRARQSLHSTTVSAENATDNFLQWAFRKETNFTNTIASLAPSPETGEQLLPGAIYVLVATLAGSIVSRNRGIFLRATFPLAVGVTAGWMLIPVTMRNTADLIWEYEKKVPALSETHALVGGFVREAWRQSKTRANAAANWADEAATDSRQKVEKWVEKGN